VKSTGLLENLILITISIVFGFVAWFVVPMVVYALLLTVGVPFIISWLALVVTFGVIAIITTT
jgi:hypothetical protein